MDQKVMSSAKSIPIDTITIDKNIMPVPLNGIAKVHNNEPYKLDKRIPDKFNGVKNGVSNGINNSFITNQNKIVQDAPQDAENIQVDSEI